MRVGLIGLGNAGGAMGAALSRHHTVIGWDLDAARQAAFAGSVAESAAALAAEAGIVVLSLPSPAASLAVAGEIRDALSAGSTLVETGTVAPGDVEALHALLAPRGVRVVDVAIVGGVGKLAAGQGVFLAGTSEAEAGAVGDLFAPIAGQLFHLPRRGDGMRMKLAVNAVAHAVYAVLVEAGALVAAQGLPLDVYEALLARESGLMRPFVHRFSERLRGHDFAGGMPVRNAAKDSALALAAAAKAGVPLHAIAGAHAAYEAALEAGLAELDYAALGTLWEERLGISFSR